MLRRLSEVLKVVSGFSVLAICLMAFVLLPDGWNLLPLLAVAVLLSMAVVGWSGNRQAMVRPDVAAAADESREAVSDADLPRRFNRAFGPVLAGIIIDIVDLATFGPLGLFLGLPIGGAAGYWMGTALGLERRAAFWCALAAGIYCTIPGTEFIPLGTILGACVRFRESGRVSTPRTPRRRRKKGDSPVAGA